MTSMTSLKALQKARDLLARGHIKRAFARDESGERVDLHSNMAVRFCPIGALARVTGTIWGPHDKPRVYTDAVDLLAQELRSKGIVSSIPRWADTRTTSEILSVFDSLIANHTPRAV